MYNLTPELGRAWEFLLLAVIDGLRQRGWLAPMQVAPLPKNLFDLWRADDLLLSQTCGYPLLVTLLGDDVQVLAAPAFDLPGCEEASYCSFIVVPQDGAHDLESLRGKVAAINQGDSQSGMNALRHTLAPLARSGRFLARVEMTGSHLASLALLQSGQADVAAIDCARSGCRSSGAAKNRRGTRVAADRIACLVGRTGAGPARRSVRASHAGARAIAGLVGAGVSADVPARLSTDRRSGPVCACLRLSRAGLICASDGTVAVKR